MAFQAVEDGGSIVVHGSWADGINTENVFGFNLTTALDQAAADTITTLMGDAFTHIQSFTNDQFVYTGCTVTDLRTETGAQFDSTAGAFPLTGTESNGALPYQTAALISWNTSLRGRSFRGRTYLGGFCENSSLGRHVGSTLVTALEAWRDELLDDGPFWGVISRFETVMGVPNTPRDPAIVTTITSGTVHPFWRTQRGRALA